MNTDNPECIILHAEANKMTPLLYALRQAFPHLNITMRNRKAQLKAIMYVQELAKDYQKNKQP